MSEKNSRKRILFVCTTNSGRSLMAEAFALKMGLNATSAGPNPAQSIYPTAIGAMREKNIDISKFSPKLLTPEMIDKAELIVTIGCPVEQLCPRPMLPRLQSKLIVWDVVDPKGKSINETRKIRDEIERKVKELSES